MFSGIVIFWVVCFYTWGGLRNMFFTCSSTGTFEIYFCGRRTVLVLSWRVQVLSYRAAGIWKPHMISQLRLSKIYFNIMVWRRAARDLKLTARRGCMVEVEIDSKSFFLLVVFCEVSVRVWVFSEANYLCVPLILLDRAHSYDIHLWWIGPDSSSP